VGRRSRSSSIPPDLGDEIYGQWELHRLAILGVERACIGGLVGFPTVFATDVLVRQAGLASDSLVAAAGRVLGLTAIVAVAFLYVRLRGDRLAHPFLLGTVLMWVVAFFDALAAAPTGGFTSPYSFGLVPVLMTWALLMPGGLRYAIAPILGGFAVYVATLAVILSGRYVLAEAAAILLFQLVGAGAGVVCAEVVEHWRRRLAVASTTDSLTGLMSRGYLFERLDELCEVRLREPGPISVVMVDLDHFKKVNDTHGHSAGDAVLRTVARAVRSVTRQVDLCGRIGGEELVVVLDRCDSDRALTVADRLRERVESTPVLVGGARIGITLSATPTTPPPC